MTSSDSLRVAAVQLGSQDSVEQNLATCRGLIEAAAAESARVVLLPENFAYLGPETGKRELAERLGDNQAPIQGMVSPGGARHEDDDHRRRLPRSERRPEAAAQHLRGIFTVGRGGRELSQDPPVRRRVAGRQKLLESVATLAGAEAVVVEVEGFKLGLSICYDLRFPELYRALVDKGAEVLLVPAAFTLQTGKDHWHVLLRARAIESQAWVVAAAQWGKHPKGRASYGHTLVADPWGTVVAECSDRVGFVVADLDRAYLERVRAAQPQPGL